MGKSTTIAWTDHTFNPWIGCQKVSPGCDHCYAEAQDRRFTGGQHWGPHALRRRTSEANWRQPLAWNRAAERAGTRRRVFCASMADVFDNQVPPEWRTDLWHLIDATPHLDWLLLTKRPQNIGKMLPVDWGNGWRNVWLGTTTEDQAEAERRIPHLLSVPAAVHFLSCEPMLGPVSLSSIYVGRDIIKPLAGVTWYPTPPDWPTQGITARHSQKIKWVICGGESGPAARPMHPDWARGLRDQCASAAVAFFFKQWGEWLPCFTDIGEEVPACHPDDGRDDRSLADHPARPVRLIGSQEMWRIGKHAAGDLLDGVQHHAWPELRAMRGQWAGKVPHA